MPIKESSTAQSQPPPIAPRNHPFGLRAIIVLLVVQAIGYVLTIGLLLMGDRLRDVTVILESDIYSQISTLMIAYSILAPLNIVAAVGLWQRKRWAWMVIMMLLAYSMTLDLVSYWAGQPIYFSMALNVIKIGYLNQREVQLIFGEIPG